MEQTSPITDALATDVGDSNVLESSLPWTGIWLAMLALSAGASAAVFASRGQGIFLVVLSFTVCLVASGFDAAHGRVPNPLTYTAILLGLGLNAIGYALQLTGREAPAQFLGAVGAREALLGAVAFSGIGIACMFFAGMGGGDMKLLAAIGALLGFKVGGTLLLYALVLAVIYALLNLAVIGRLNLALRALAIDFLALVLFRQAPTPAPTSARWIPMAVPILVALPLMRIVPPEQVEAWLKGVAG